MPITTSAEFVAWFRSVAPYINAFRGRTFVIAFGGEVVADGKFVELTHDFNLLASLGIRLVLVHGARPQIEQHLAKNNIVDTYHQGIRLTDAETMQCVKEAVGRVRVEIEALLSMGLANSPMANADIRVAGGNFITAQPIGIINGVDLHAHRQRAQGGCRRAERPHGIRRGRAALAARLFAHRRSVQRHAGRRRHRDRDRAGCRQADVPDGHRRRA